MRSMIERPNLVLVKTTARAKTRTRWLETSLESREAEVRERHTLFSSFVLCHSRLHTVNNQSAESQLFQLSYHPLHSHSCLETVQQSGVAVLAIGSFRALSQSSRVHTVIRHRWQQSDTSVIAFLLFYALSQLYGLSNTQWRLLWKLSHQQELCHSFLETNRKSVIAVLPVRSFHALSSSYRDYA